MGTSRREAYRSRALGLLLLLGLLAMHGTPAMAMPMTTGAAMTGAVAAAVPAPGVHGAPRPAPRPGDSNQHMLRPCVSAAARTAHVAHEGSPRAAERTPLERSAAAGVVRQFHDPGPLRPPDLDALCVSRT